MEAGNGMANLGREGSGLAYDVNKTNMHLPRCLASTNRVTYDPPSRSRVTW